MTVELVGSAQNILELGCSAGHVTQRLRAKGARVTGVEIDPDMARAAEKYAESVTVADLDVRLPHEIFQDRTFDAIVVGDVFEHLKRPKEVLMSLARLLEPGGRLITSIPNVTHADVRFMLLAGIWRYQDGGLLDRTHLRFFDAQAVDDLFANSGFRIIQVERTIKEPFESELAPIIPKSQLPDAAVEFALADPDSRTYQFVVVAVPDSSTNTDSEPVTVDSARKVAPSGSEAQSNPMIGRLWEENEFLRIRARGLDEEMERVRWELERSLTSRPLNRLKSLARSLNRRVRASSDR